MRSLVYGRGMRNTSELTLNKPVAWTRTDVDSPIIHEEMMQRHPELRPHYPVPLFYGSQDWYIVEFWLDGEKRGRVRQGSSLDAVYEEEVAAGVDVINVILV